MNRSITWIIKTESYAPQLIPRLEPGYRPRIPLIKGHQFLLRKDSATLPKFYTFHLSPRLPPKRPMAFYYDDCSGVGGGKDVIRFSGITGPCLWTDTNSGHPELHCGPAVRVAAYGGHVINVVSDQIHLTADRVGPQTHPGIISQVQNASLKLTYSATGRIPYIASNENKILKWLLF